MAHSAVENSDLRVAIRGACVLGAVSENHPIMMGDRREDWAVPQTDCWVAQDDGSWSKGRILSVGPTEFIVSIEGGPAVTRREFQLRPRDKFKYGKDRPVGEPSENRRK